METKCRYYVKGSGCKKISPVEKISNHCSICEKCICKVHVEKHIDECIYEAKREQERARLANVERVTALKIAEI